jgi:cytochrome c peroxidase
MKRIDLFAVALSLATFTLAAGCNDSKPQPAAKNKTGADSTTGGDSKTAGDTSTPPKTETAAKSDKLILGADELFAGIPGSAELTEEEIKLWLDKPENHEPLKFELPLGLHAGKGAMKGIEQNPLTRAKIELGRQLYFDPRLSANIKISCASCHAPNHGFAFDSQFGIGIDDKQGGRNSPVAYNRILSDLQFWDGRAATLEEQAKGPIANEIEMGHTHEACVECIKGVPGYKMQFEKVFAEGGKPGETNIENIAKAIASFERALVTGPSAYDYAEEFNKRFKDRDPDEITNPRLKAEYEAAKTGMEKYPMSPEAVRGQALFFGKANCSLCHVGANLTDEKYHNLGVGMDKEKPDLGRYEVSKDEKDKGAFKTPTIRNVAESGPYMHDGSQKTLEEVVEWYNKGGHKNEFLSDKIKPLNLTDQEKKDLVAFMKACSGTLPKVNEAHKPK